MWARARIPTQRIDSCVRKLSRYYEKYMSIKKNRTRQRQSDRLNEEKFKLNMKKLFDIATNDATATIRNEEDRKFLQKQRADVFCCSMSGADLSTTAKEPRKRQRENK